MPPTDSDIICAAQSGDDSSIQARSALISRFGKLMRYFAGKAIGLFGLDPSEVEDVFQDAAADLFDPAIARFDPTRPGASVQNYLRGLIQNAARRHSRFVRNGDAVRHEYAAPENARQHLPASSAEVHDTADDLAIAIDSEQTASDTAKVMRLATPEMTTIIRGVYHRGETPEQVAAAMGVDRTTVTRRLARFRVAVLSSAPYHAA
jgi:RNA polymerase sigma factor (sigma-70 family)